MLDHVAIRVADRAATSAELIRLLEWHVIEATDRFTLLGAHGDHGKLTLLDAAAGDRPMPGRLVSIVLADSAGAGTRPPIALAEGLVATFTPLGGLGRAWKATPRHAVVGVSLRATDPPIAAARLEAEHGMRVESMSPELAVLDVDHGASSGRITLSRERWDHEVSSMLDHVGIRVPDAEEWRRRAERAEVEVVKWVEAPHSRAVFVAGPDHLLLEFVELTRSLEQ